MVASRNPKLGAVTMLSVPRDLYVNTTGIHIKGRINEVFAVGMGRKQNFETGARYMSQQLQEIMGVEIPYYVLIDFDGFEGVVDSLGGIDVFVEKPILDTTYPSSETNIMTFRLGSGMQHLDGKTALMFARSRHSTSDFARSLRQQLIVKAIMKQLTSKDVLLSPTKIKNLYADYTKMVQTNITADEMIGMSRYAYNLEHIFSFGFTTDCSNSAWKYSVPACFLVAPPRELFDGAAVMIPVGPNNSASFYDYTKKFAFYVLHNQNYLIEDANIVIQNGIDKKYAKQIKRKPDGHANAIASKLKKYAFKVINVENTKQVLTGTTIFIVGTGEYQKTIETLRGFITIDDVVQPQLMTGEFLTTTT
jgi:LCP family protein required for cell wall assembly